MPFRRPRARLARRRRHLQRRDRRLHDRRRPRRAAHPEAGRRSRSARRSASAIGWCRPSRRASRTSSAADGCIRCRRARCSAFRRGSARSSARGCSRGPASCAWAPSCSCRRAGRGRRVDRRVHDAALRRRSDDVSRRAAAGRHPRGRRRSPVDPRAVSALRRGRARSTAACCARSAAQRRATVSVDGAFRSLPGGLSEMVRALVARLPPDSVRLNTPVRRAASAGAAAPSKRATPRRSADAPSRRHRHGAGVRRGRSRARSGRRPRAALSGSTLRVHGHHRARVPAIGGRASAERIGVRRAARRTHRHPGRVVAVVEVAAPGARRTAC